MTRYFFLLIISCSLLSGLSSCKKAVDKIQENAIFEIITKGQWIVAKFEKGGSSILPEYTDYVFQFYKNGVVSAMKTGSPNVDGQWSVSTETLSISATFPGAADPIKRFNGTWLITKIEENLVEGVNAGGLEPFVVAFMKN